MQKLLFAVALLASSLLGSLGSSLAHAHVFWIQASDYQPEPGTRVQLTLNVGADFSGDVIPRIDEWLNRFESHDAFGMKPVAGELGDDPAGYLDAESYSSLVIYRSEREFVELHAGKFNEYLEKEGLDWVIDYRQQNGLSDTWGREWFSRCAKALIRPQGTHTGPEYNQSTGMPLELIPLEDPYSLDKSGYLPVKVLFNDKPLSGIQVVAYSASKPEKKIIETTDNAGIATFYVTLKDLWLIKAVHMIHAPANDKNVDWESFWASFTFETDIQ